MKKKHKVWLVIIAVIVIAVFFTNAILSNLVSKVVNAELKKISNKGEVVLTVEKIKIDIFTSNISLEGLHIKPDSLYFENFKLGKTYKAVATEFYLSNLKIRGFNIFKILLFQEISAKKIIAKGINLNLYKSDIYLKSTEKIEKMNKNSFDSIFIKGVNQIDLSSIEFNDFEMKIFHAQKGDTLFSYKEKACEISGIALNTYQNAPNYFKFNKDSLKISLKNQNFELDKGNFNLVLDDIVYDYPKKRIKISNFTLKPSIDKVELAKTFKYNKDIFDVETKEINFYGLYIDSIVKNGVVNIDSIAIDGLNLAIYKDQSKPFDLQKRPLFLNQKLKNLTHPLCINKVTVRNSNFSYEEKYANKNEHLTLTISNLNATLNEITSIKDSINTDKKLTINLSGKLNNEADLNLDIFMPYNTSNDSFSFVGSVGNAKFSTFNSAVFPAAGVKFESGQLHSIHFAAHGTPSGTEGEMTMLYSDLNATFIKEHEEKKALSWIGNSIIVQSNPSTKGKLRNALIEAERVPYKGFGNLLWKSVMSGLVNTVNPVGKTIKASKYEHQVEKEQRKEFNKDARKEARKTKKEQKN
jgi:hypothetical protein